MPSVLPASFLARRLTSLSAARAPLFGHRTSGLPIIQRQARREICRRIGYRQPVTRLSARAAAAGSGEDRQEPAAEIKDQLPKLLKGLVVILVKASIRLLEALLASMGICVSKDERVPALEAKVKQLQAQLAASNGGGKGAVAVAGGVSEVLFFPIKALPCRHGRNCRRGSACTYSHERTSLVRLLEYLDSARLSLDICVFSLTLNEIAERVSAAHKRGVRVRIVCDDDQMAGRGSDIADLRRQGIPCRHDRNLSHMHHKFCVIDGRVLINGSLNWTRAGVLENEENVVVTDSPAVVSRFSQQFDHLWSKFRGNAV